MQRQKFKLSDKIRFAPQEIDLLRKIYKQVNNHQRNWNQDRTDFLNIDDLLKHPEVLIHGLTYPKKSEYRQIYEKVVAKESPRVFPPKFVSIYGNLIPPLQNQLKALKKGVTQIKALDSLLHLIPILQGGDPKQTEKHIAKDIKSSKDWGIKNISDIKKFYPGEKKNVCRL